VLSRSAKEVINFRTKTEGIIKTREQKSIILYSKILDFLLFSELFLGYQKRELLLCKHKQLANII